ncbi:hypothetical protein K488DRAFT_6626, partial [Vararia minispora EC-137]
MTGAACLLFILSTMRTIFDAVHVYTGFIKSGDPIAYFNVASRFTFKNIVYIIQTLVGDGILIYRCYVVWRSLWIIALPCVLWIGTAFTGALTCWSISQSMITSTTVFIDSSTWILSFFATTLCTNTISTSMLAYKLWKVNSAVARYRESTMLPAIIIILECGAMYTVALIIQIITYNAESNSIYLTIDITGQIITITFYLLIIRAGLSRL